MALIDQQEALAALTEYANDYLKHFEVCAGAELHRVEDCIALIKALQPAQQKRQYTEEELRVFAHGISLSLLSKRSAQHWHYDEDMAAEIRFLEQLYEKVEADMRGKQDECIENLPPMQPKPKTEKCKWIRYDYRTICPKNHDIDNPYWRIPEKTECLKYCPYCGKEIEVEK